MSKQCRCRICFLFFFSILSSSAFCADDLWRIYQKAINNDPTFKQQKFTYEADKEAIDQATSELKPQINVYSGVGSIYENTQSDTDFFSGDSTYTNKNAGINLSQTIWDKSKFENLKLARNQVYLSSLQFENSRQDLFLRIATSYFNLLAAQNSLSVAEHENAVLKEQFDQASGLLDAGMGTSTDYFQSQSRLRLVEVDVLNAQNLIADQRQALAEIIGESVQELVKPGENFPISDPSPNDIEEWLKTGFKNNYELAASHQQVDIARQNIEIARSGFWPSLNLNADQTYNDNNNGINGANEAKQRRLMLELTAPIYQGGQVKSQTQEAVNRYRASLQNTQRVLRSIDRRIRNAYKSVVTSKNQVSALLEAVSASENTLRARQKSFENGLNTNLEVLDATRDLFSSQRDLLRARYNYIINLFTLKSLAGILSEIDFRRTSDLLTQ